MEDFVRKNIHYIVAVFLLIGPILDFFTGICLHYSCFVTLGVIARLFFLAFICYIVLFVFKKRKLLVPYFLVGFYFLLYMLGIFLYRNGYGFFFEVQNLVKVFYFPLMLVSLSMIREHIRISKMVFSVTLFTYLFLILVPSVFHVGYRTYAITKTGSLGFFHSANEISGILSLLTPILFLSFFTWKRKIFKYLFVILYFIVILMVGTKTPLLAFCFTLGVSLAYFLNHLRKKGQYSKIFFSCLAVFLAFSAFILFLPKTNFYKNIEVHLDFLEVDEVSDLFSKKNFDHFIFSQRLSFLENKSTIYHEAPLYQKLFGVGYLLNRVEMKQIEMDYFDIFYNHGVIGFLLFFSLVGFVFFQVFRLPRQRTYEYLMLKTSFALILILSFFTGHILISPSVSFLCTVLILSLFGHSKGVGILLINEKLLEKGLDSHSVAFVSFYYSLQNLFHLLFFQILSYQLYDFCICDDTLACRKYGETLSPCVIIISEKKDVTSSFTKKEFLKKLDDGFLKKCKCI